MIEISRLSVTYPDGNNAIKDISFFVPKGEKVALIGENGAGKTTLLHSIIGLVPCSNGVVKIDGIVLDKKTLPTVREKVGMVFQNPDDQLFMSKVCEDIAFGPRNFNISEEETNVRIDRALKMLGISHLKDRRTSRLSGGEKRRVAIATVLVMKPSVLMFDEPSSFLDPRSRRSLIHELKSLEHTQLIATHDLDMALDLCDSVILLKNGKIHAMGPASQILTDENLLERCGLELPLRLIKDKNTTI